VLGLVCEKMGERLVVTGLEEEDRRTKHWKTVTVSILLEEESGEDQDKEEDEDTTFEREVWQVTDVTEEDLETTEVLWSKLATSQDTHDRESNVPFVPLRSTLGFGCAREEKNKQQWMTGETPSATARFYSNGRNSYSTLVSCARRPSKMASCSSSPCLVSCSIFVQDPSSKEHVKRTLSKILHRGYLYDNTTSILVKCWTWLNMRVSRLILHDKLMEVTGWKVTDKEKENDLTWIFSW
jgi:hypothetical protein